MKSTSFKAAAGKLALAGLLMASAVGALADDALKIGYVNTERVLRESAPAKAAQTRLEAEFSKRLKDRDDTALKVKAAADKLDKDGPTLPEAERVRRQRELVEQDRDQQRKGRELSDDLNQRRTEEFASIVERANKALKQIADTEKFDIILQGDAVVFPSPRVDITDKVIKALNTPVAK